MSTKYGIVSFWPKGWSQSDKTVWYDSMSAFGMGYLHSIYTFAELDPLFKNGSIELHTDYIKDLKQKHNFNYHLLIRNPSISNNAVPQEYKGLTFEDSSLTKAFYDISIKTIVAFGECLDYLTIGGEGDYYFVNRWKN